MYRSYQCIICARWYVCMENQQAVLQHRVNVFNSTTSLFWVIICRVILTQKHTERESEHHDCAICYRSSQMAHYFLSLSPSFAPFLLFSLAPSDAVHSSLFAHAEALPVDPVHDFPKADINITGHCNGVIFMEAPEEVTWLWLVPRGPGVSIKLVVLTHITINEVEKLRK